MGPYTKTGKPLLVSGDNGVSGVLNSPGGADVSPDVDRFVFHADKEVGDARVRQMRVGRLKAQGTVVEVV